MLHVDRYINQKKENKHRFVTINVFTILKEQKFLIIPIQRKIYGDEIKILRVFIEVANMEIQNACTFKFSDIDTVLMKIFHKE